MEFTALVGWRPKSSKALKWSDVNVKAGTITIGTSKNGQAQVLPIAGPLLGLLKRREKARLFTDPDGEPRVSEYVFHRGGRQIGDTHKAWASALKKAGLPKGRLRYDLKRTAARGLREKVDEQTAMAGEMQAQETVIEQKIAKAAETFTETIVELRAEYIQAAMEDEVEEIRERFGGSTRWWGKR